MYIGVAILTDNKIHNISRKITFDLNKKYGTGIEAALLPQHISLKQSFPYEGDIEEIVGYIEEFCLRLKPFKVLIEKVETKLFGEENILGWLKVRESKELRDIHIKLCTELNDKFNIKPLGFDGEGWEFHSTLTNSKINQNSLNELIAEYNNKEIYMEFIVKEIAVFCCVGDYTKNAEYFSIKIFNLESKD